MMLARKLSPKQLEKHNRILAAALRVFAHVGYSSASMDVIAFEAEVSKPTLYMYFGSKEQLFEAMMIAERDVMLEPFVCPTGDMVRDLYDFAWAYADIVMKPEYLSLARLIIGEAHRFPDIGRAYQKAGPDRLLRGIIAYLEDQKKSAHLTFEDAELAAEDLWALILSAPRNKALHIPDEVQTHKDIGRFVVNGLSVFLKAYATKPDQALFRLRDIVTNDKKKVGRNDARHR
jgi:TetR/AcrR family transcriptional regulator, mexJK operon transcriptional repressor